MTAAACSDEEFIKLFETQGPQRTAEILGIGLRNIYRRRASLESIKYIHISAPSNKNTRPENKNRRVKLDVTNGVILIGSDAHYWPGYESTAHRAFVRLCKELKPVAVVMNGDAFDGARISRFPESKMSSNKPKVSEEIEAVTDRLQEITSASEDAKHYWLLGNHDMRYETLLAQRVPELSGVKGMTLDDHFPDWHHAIILEINKDIVVKHRFKGGIHATHNNTLWSGKTIVTGHLHSLKVTPFSDYNGTRWGVDTGTLADPDGSQFEYSEENPLNHRSGFVVLTIRAGKLLQPEVVMVVDSEHVDFRGQLLVV